MDDNRIIILFQSFLDHIVKENEILIENSNDNTINIELDRNNYFRDVVGIISDITRKDAIYDTIAISRVLNSITKYLLFKHSLVSIDSHYDDNNSTDNNNNIIDNNSIMLLSPIMLEILHCVRSIINHELYENIKTSGICLLLAIVSRKIPHLKGYITEILLKSNHLLQLSELTNNMTASLLSSLRILYFSGCIGSDELRPDIGIYLSIYLYLLL
jgi:hypothetical protein